MTDDDPGAIPDSSHDTYELAYGYGQSSLGAFLVAIDNKRRLCAVLFGKDPADLLDGLRRAFPGKSLLTGGNPDRCGPVVNAVARLIEQPGASVDIPTPTRGGDFEQMVRAALALTKPGTTTTPEEVAARIGAPPESAPYVRACAAADLLAVVAPYHRLQEQDGTNPVYRWGEGRRQALLKREAAIRVA